MADFLRTKKLAMHDAKPIAGGNQTNPLPLDMTSIVPEDKSQWPPPQFYDYSRLLKSFARSETLCKLTCQAGLLYVHDRCPDDSCAVRWVLGISVHDGLDGQIGSAAELGGRQARSIGSDKADDLVR
jgi:hypothetical protein